MLTTYQKHYLETKQTTKNWIFNLIFFIIEGYEQILYSSMQHWKQENGDGNVEIHVSRRAMLMVLRKNLRKKGGGSTTWMI